MQGRWGRGSLRRSGVSLQLVAWLPRTLWRGAGGPGPARLGRFVPRILANPDELRGRRLHCGHRGYVHSEPCLGPCLDPGPVQMRSS